MIDLERMEIIEAAIRDFAEGNPQQFEIDVLEGVWFDFDCTFEMDLTESTIPVAVGIKDWSPYNQGEPETSRLMDYSGEMDDLTAALDEAFYNGGSRNEEIEFVYSEHNSNGDHLVFNGSIDNPRVSNRGNSVVVSEVGP